MFAPSDASAAVTGIAAAPGVSCPSSNTPSGLVANCECYAGIANRIVGCVRQTLDNAAQVFFSPQSGFYSLVKTAIFALITLGVAIYGAMLAAGMVEKPSRDTMLILLKIGFVVWAVENSQWIYDYLMAMIDALSSAMFQFNTLENLPGNSCPNLSSVWMRIDCVLDKVIGINMSQFDPALHPNIKEATRAVADDGLKNGLLGVFFTMMKGSDVGFMIGAIGIISTWTMIVFLIKVLFAFLAAFIGLVFMVIIGPLFIPLILFKATKQYFDKWVKVVISTALQPVLLLSFVTFAVAAMDLVIFTGEKSIYRTIAGDAVFSTDFNMNQYMLGDVADHGDINASNSRQLDIYTGGFLIRTSTPGVEVKGDDNVDDFERMIGRIEGPVGTDFSECISNNIGIVTPGSGEMRSAQLRSGNPLAGMTECSRTFAKRISFYEIDYQRMAEARIPVVDVSVTAQPDDGNVDTPLARAMKRELLSSVVLAAAMMFLVNALMRVVPEICNDLTGEFMYTPNYFNMGGDWKAQDAISDSMSQQTARARRGSS